MGPKLPGCVLALTLALLAGAWAYGPAPAPPVEGVVTGRVCKLRPTWVYASACYCAVIVRTARGEVEVEVPHEDFPLYARGDLVRIER